MMPQDYATILCLQGHSQPYSKGISLQKWGSVGAKNCIVTKWPLCKGLKLSLCVEEISTGIKRQWFVEILDKHRQTKEFPTSREAFGDRPKANVNGMSSLQRR